MMWLNRSLRRSAVVLFAAICIIPTGCRPLRNYAMNQVAGILADSSVTFHTDDDPELVAEALPFALKLIDGTLTERPNHRGLLMKATSGYTEYAYGFIKQRADEAEDEDFEEAQHLRLRAKKLFLRARGYGLRGLKIATPEAMADLRVHPKTVAARYGKRDVAFLYWTGAAWGSAISMALDDPDLVADQPVVEAFLERALALDETYEDGAIHSAMISVEMARQGATGDPEAKARRHFARAVELSREMQAAPYVSLAEAVSVKKQKREEFRSLLEKALAIDADAVPEWRTANLVMQRRARWLLEREDDLFVEAGAAAEDDSSMARAHPAGLAKEFAQ